MKVKTNEFENVLGERAAQADRMIAPFLPAEEGYQRTLFQAVNYSVKAGGKRIRPVIMNEVYRMCGGTDDAVIAPFMAALEMIHTYSLVHDDLPAMDDDDYRRGKLTTHKKFGEAMGILAGDALLNLAYETAFRVFDTRVDQTAAASALAVLGHKAGMYGMVGGQVVDVEENGHFLDEDMLMFVYEKKTSALLEAAFMIGGILAGASEGEVDRLEKAGRKLGVAFQIQDDILDVVGDEQKIGKPVHSDEDNKKSTYAAMHGIGASKDKVREYTDDAIGYLDGFGGTKEFLTDLMNWLVERDC